MLANIVDSLRYRQIGNPERFGCPFDFQSKGVSFASKLLLKSD